MIPLVNTQEISRTSDIGSREKNDCVVRSFMSAFDISYDKAHSFCKEKLNRKDKGGVYNFLGMFAKFKR